MKGSLISINTLIALFPLSIHTNNIEVNEKIATQAEAITLDEVIKIAGKESIGLLKLDCKEYEYLILN